MSFFKNKSDDLKEIKINEENTVIQPVEPEEETALFWIDTSTDS